MKSHQDPLPNAADPGVPATPVRHFRSVLLGWTDAETGDRLSVRMDGNRTLLSQLQQDGFELLSSDEAESLPSSQTANDETGLAPGAGSEERLPAIDSSAPDAGSPETQQTLSFTARLLTARAQRDQRNTA